MIRSCSSISVVLFVIELAPSFSLLSISVESCSIPVVWGCCLELTSSTSCFIVFVSIPFPMANSSSSAFLQVLLYIPSSTWTAIPEVSCSASPPNFACTIAFPSSWLSTSLNNASTSSTKVSTSPMLCASFCLSSRFKRPALTPTAARTNPPKADACPTIVDKSRIESECCWVSNTFKVFCFPVSPIEAAFWDSSRIGAKAFISTSESDFSRNRDADFFRPACSASFGPPLKFTNPASFISFRSASRSNSATAISLADDFRRFSIAANFCSILSRSRRSRFESEFDIFLWISSLFVK